MNKLRKDIFFGFNTILWLFLLSGCLNITYTHHNQYKAIMNANKFLMFLLNKNYKEAYLKLDTKALRKITLDNFEKTMHKVFFEMPKDIEGFSFDYFLFVPGEKAIQLYYKILYESSIEIPLHLVLLGNAREGYKIFIINVGNIVKYQSNVKYFGLKEQKIEGEIIVKSDTIIITPDSLREKLDFEMEEKL